MKKFIKNISHNAKKAISVKINTKEKNKVLKRYIYLIEKKRHSILKENILHCYN